MRSDLPKPLQPLCGLPLARHVVRACQAIGISRIVVIIGHEADRVRAGLGDDVEYVLQEEQLGTGHAALCAEEALSSFHGPVLILAGDVPLLRPETLADLVAAVRAGGRCGAMLTATMDDPTGYGRVIRAADGGVLRIVEQRDATPEESAIREWNPSIYCFRADGLFERLRRVRAENAQREYYLTDVVGLATADGEHVGALPVRDNAEVIGVNSKVELAEAGRALRERILLRHMLAGVTVADPATTYADLDVVIGRDTVVEPNTHLRGATEIGRGCVIGPNAVISDCRIGDGSTVVASHVVSSDLGAGVRVGPFANVRAGCRIGDCARIGDFVELKNAAIGEGVAAGHLSYIGDAEVGPRTNVGAGTITCNYDGRRKHRTIIGAGAFVGSHTTLIAPVEVGDGAMTAAGTVVTERVPDGALAIARTRQANREEWAVRWRLAHERREAQAGEAREGEVREGEAPAEPAPPDQERKSE
jgi:bifunctional UDP-N-acetylglucosamine pyrophosphorylase/glucosamine-1-phosphate N-acetyltransferase